MAPGRRMIWPTSGPGPARETRLEPLSEELLGLPSNVKYMVTGAVLLVAATIDAVSRRGRYAPGGA
jgi:hypothetical protein